MQEEEVLEAQKRDQWAPKVGSMVFIPRLKGNSKVGFRHPDVGCISADNGHATKQACMRSHFALKRMQPGRWCPL